VVPAEDAVEPFATSTPDLVTVDKAVAAACAGIAPDSVAITGTKPRAINVQTVMRLRAAR
jgi:hypothetical protein